MRIVSEEYRKLAKLEENNNKHTYLIRNETKDFELTDLVVNTNFSISRFLRTAQGNISPNSLNLRLEALSLDSFNSKIIEFRRKYNEFLGKKWKELLNYESIEEFLVNNGDIITVTDTFNNENLVLFKGVVKNRKITDKFNGREVEITVEDNTIKGYEHTFSEDVFFENHYIANNEEKEKSLLHILTKNYLEFDDSQLEIMNMKLSNNEYMKVPIAIFDKGKKIMEVVANLVRSVYGNIYTLPNGNLKINSIFNNRDYIERLNITLGNKKSNYPILEFIELTEITPNQNKVEVKYKNVVAEEVQDVFSLSGQNAKNGENDAKIIISKNTSKETVKEYWRIDFNNIVELNKVPIVEMYRYENTQKVPITTNIEQFYELVFEKGKSNIAKVRFFNPTNNDVFIKTFKFRGKPIINYKDNSVSYTEIKDLKENEINLKSVSNEYVTSKEQALELAKHTYYNECRTYNKIKLKTNNVPFLALEDTIKLDYKKYRGEYQIIAITQTNNYTELVLKEYKEYQAIYENFITEKSDNTIDNFLRSKNNLEKEKETLKSGEYEYNKDNVKYIVDLGLDTEKYNILAFLKQIPLNVPQGTQAVCEVVREKGKGFYVKVGIENSSKKIIANGSAIWLATRKE